MFKYLGFLITPSGEIKSGLTDLKDRALKGFYKLKNAMGDSFRSHIGITLHLFDALIKPTTDRRQTQNTTPSKNFTTWSANKYSEYKNRQQISGFSWN